MAFQHTTMQNINLAIDIGQGTCPEQDIKECQPREFITNIWSQTVTIQGLLDSPT